MPPIDSVRFVKFLQYTGANGPEVAAWVGGPAIQLDNGNRLILGADINDPFIDMVKDQWVSETGGIWSNHDYTTFWASRASLAGTDLVGTSDISSISVPLLVLNGTAERVVTWARPFPDANYKVSFAHDVNTLGRITAAVKPGTKTTTGVTITLTAGLAVTVAGVVHVLGTT